MAPLIWLSSVHIWHSLLKLFTVCQRSMCVCGGGRLQRCTKTPYTNLHTHTLVMEQPSMSHTLLTNTHTGRGVDSYTIGFHSLKIKSFMSFHKCSIFSVSRGKCLFFLMDDTRRKNKPAFFGIGKLSTAHNCAVQIV